MAYTLVDTFMKKQDSSQPQTDFEATVEQRIRTFRTELRREDFNAPSWDHGWICGLAMSRYHRRYKA